ncbi:hypothetical protein BOW53_16715 [Solemya pervernicosa gill symbiont]|uniref:Uncharacterized protein n=1 Tax=Solemya pervernicosa gill symbiont TaxID=642797 RepID=A0A1T2KYX2_9GAMM|nr:hypothetical protein [Solemya pervernicosa gill symbiont]OOZ38033.1 hypothetical protein BOW53_16715 [Solemya pervernicosa gill symbiont]
MKMICHKIDRHQVYLFFDSPGKIKKHEDYLKNVASRSIETLLSAQNNSALSRNKDHWAAPVMTVHLLLVNDNVLKHQFAVLIRDKELPGGALESLTLTELIKVEKTAREYEALRSKSCFNNCDDDWSSSSKTCTCKANKRVDEKLISKLFPDLSEVSDEKHRHMEIVTTSNEYSTYISISLHRRPICSACSSNWEDEMLSSFNDILHKIHIATYGLMKEAANVILVAHDIPLGANVTFDMLFPDSSIITPNTFWHVCKYYIGTNSMGAMTAAEVSRVNHRSVSTINFHIQAMNKYLNNMWCKLGNCTRGSCQPTRLQSRVQIFRRLNILLNSGC